MIGMRSAGLAGMAAVALVLMPAAQEAVMAAGEPDRDPPPLVISHRGSSAAAPEHTFAAYDLAVEQHTDVLECDLQLTADDVLVCIHDTAVDRTTGGAETGRVDAFTLEQLRGMDFGAWFGPEFAGASVVPFEEQLRCYRTSAPGVQFYAETKAPAEYAGRMEPALVKLLNRLELIPSGEADVRSAPVIIQSFELASLEQVKQLAPTLPTAWLWAIPPDGWITGDGVMPTAVDVMAPVAAYIEGTPGLADRVHDAGRELHTWTVDDPAAIDRLLDLGVDGIFSNQTATLRERVDARTGRSAREPVELERGCPGIAGSVTAATDDAPVTSAPTANEASGSSDAADDDSNSWLPIAALVAGVGALGIAGVWWFKRRRI